MKQEAPHSRKLVIATLLIILLLGVGYIIYDYSQNNSVVTEGNANIERAPKVTGQPTLGNENSEITIVEFGDYKCPSCKAWGEQIWPKLKTDYVDTGKVKFSFVNTLFHGEESLLGSSTGEAIFQMEPKAFWEFHELLFEAQPVSDHDALWLTEGRISDLVSQSFPQIDLAELQLKISSTEVRNEIEKDNQLVTQHNIKQTPSIMVNHILIGNPFDYKSIVEAIEQERN
ncbi:DsbA family protein [Paenibacillus sp. UMB7766-LJ446]|uniref:DsbA family protein n=1 Tax=Paenibacillus sp. UMB7766-LJ446 TaxID=3046313 RepID=UPI0025508242|nr:DsbA family protein [Paenibacillus sp. UMB7766-LJ446]MDK8193077.1 DsbA family protein [Paenibacillus sp. UMB7766-LJ446]